MNRVKHLVSKWIKYIVFVAIVFFISGIIFLIELGYSYSWTGFSEYIATNPNIVRGKTLWDWMELLIVPLVLAGGIFFLNRAERNTEHEITLDYQRESAFQSYIDKISQLLLVEKLLTTKRNEVRNVARTRTISILRTLDKKRSDFVIQFLVEAHLIDNKNSILNQANMERMNLQNLQLIAVYLQEANLHLVDLRDADLTDSNLDRTILNNANLERAFLWGISLRGAELENANLRNAILRDAIMQDAILLEADLSYASLANANLQGAILAKAKLRHAVLSEANLQDVKLQITDLEHADLEGANLQGAKLQGANLQGANLRGANLRDAILQDTNLRGAIVTKEQLAEAIVLDGTFYPYGLQDD